MRSRAACANHPVSSNYLIPAGTGSMAIHARHDGATNSICCVTRNHLGSASAFMGQAGNLLANLGCAALTRKETRLSTVGPEKTLIREAGRW